VQHSVITAKAANKPNVSTPIRAIDDGTDTAEPL
jgi:hypothetical protein